MSRERGGFKAAPPLPGYPLARLWRNSVIDAWNRWPILRHGPFGSGSGWGSLWYQRHPHPELVEGWAM